MPSAPTSAIDAASSLLLARARLDGAASQAVFRMLLDTLSRPGSTMRLPTRLLTGSAPAALLPALALANVDSRVAVIDTGAASDPWQSVVCTATDARLAVPEQADIVVSLAGLRPELVHRLRKGTALAPEQGTRLCVACTALRPVATDAVPRRAAPDTVRLTLSGPGVAGFRSVEVDGIDASVFDAITTANTGFPAGIDVHLVDASGCVMSLPRSTSIAADVAAAMAAEEEL